MNFWVNGRQILYNTTPSSAKYQGLLNQGATCYLNSVLQVLFMTEDFREAVERHTSKTPGPIDQHLKELFEILKTETADTFNIMNTLGIDKVNEQQDAAEYFERILSLTSCKKSKIFHGQLTHKNICSLCHTEKDNDEDFWHLPLALVGSCSKESYSVVNGIEECFRPYVFSGDNQMYCDKCDAKSNATNKCVIKHHPEVLMLLLKRFKFDCHYMTYVKINCTVDVPYTLQIPENQTYKLYAVVDHDGDLRSGHYTATIKDDESWYHFNDDKVTLLDYQPFQVDNFEKFRTAYLLFYRKTKVNAADTCTQDTGEVSSPGSFPSAISDISEQCEDAGKSREGDEVEGATEASNQNMPKYDQRCEQRSRSRHKKHEAQREEKRDDEGVKEQKRGDENCQDVEDHNSEGLDDIGQSCSDQKITIRYTRHNNVCVVKQAKEQEDEHVQSSTVRRAGSAGSSRLTENQADCSLEKMRQEDLQPRGRTGFNQDTIEKRHESVKSRSCSVKISEKEFMDGIQRSSDTKHISTQTVAMSEGHLKGKLDPKTDREAILSESIHNLKLSEATSEEPQKCRPRRVTGNTQEENEPNSTVDRKARTKRKVSDTQEQCAEMKPEKKKRKGWSFSVSQKKQREEKSKHEKHLQTNEKHEQQRKEKMDVKGVKEKKRGVVKARKSKENKIDKHIQNRADSPPTRAGSTGSRRQTGNQEVCSVEKMRHGDSQPRARTGFNQDTNKGRCNPEHLRLYHVKITEEEFEDGIQRSSETKYISMQTVGGSSQDINIWVENNDFCNLKLSESPSPEPQKH